MEDLFIRAINVSIVADLLVLAILIFRLTCKKAPAKLRVLMWGLVWLRLLIPFRIESAMSFVPSESTVPESIIHDKYPAIDTGVRGLDEMINPLIKESFSAKEGVPSPSLHDTVITLGFIWLLGILLMLIYQALSLIILRIKNREAIRVKDNIYLTDRFGSPFILGFLKPTVYLPMSLSESDKKYAILHENTHILRRDHLWKPLAFAVLAVYWFNPLVWIAYILFCRDIELACDRAAIENLDSAERAEYAEALLHSSTGRKITPTPLSFGEVSVKSRIKCIKDCHAKSFGTVIFTIIVTVIFAAGFLTHKKPVSVALRPGIWQAESVVAKSEKEVAGSVPHFVFTESGDLLVKKSSKNSVTYSRLGLLDTAYLSSEELKQIIGELSFYSEYDTEALLKGGVKAMRLCALTVCEIDAEELFIFDLSDNLYFGYASEGKINILYKMTMSEDNPTYLYGKSYVSEEEKTFVEIDPKNNKMRILFGKGCSYEAHGDYVLKNGKLKMTTNDDHKLSFVFNDNGDSLILSDKDSDIDRLQEIIGNQIPLLGYYSICGIGK